MVHPDVAQYGLDPWGLMYVPIPFIILATITICLRVWIRISFTRTFWWDDWALIGSYVSLDKLYFSWHPNGIDLTGALCRYSIFLSLAVLSQLGVSSSTKELLAQS